MHEPAETTDLELPKVLTECFTLGPFQTNTYLIRTSTGTGCWIVDPSFNPGPVVARIRALGLKPEAILLTHAHIDHIAGLPDIRKVFPGVPVSLHRAEADWLEDPERNGSAFFGSPVSMTAPEVVLEGNERLSLNGTTWQTYHVPGHSPGSVAFYAAAAELAVSGDALFAGSIGRTDLPGGDHEQLLKAIRSTLYTLPGTTRILSGHGNETTVGREMRSNPFVRAG